MRFSACSPLLVLAVAALLAAQEKTNRSYPPDLPGAKVVTYKTVGDAKLNLYVYEPKGHKPENKTPAIVFFFGGGWNGGTPKQFEQHCKHLAERGMVAMTADYRVASRHQVKAVSCVADAKSAIRYVRQHAVQLGIDPNRIVAGGGSAGGHLAACTGVVKAYDEPGEDLKISSVPNALALFNPAVVLAPVEGVSETRTEKAKGLGDRMGVEPSKLSPYHNVASGAPPTIIFHGKSDTTVPYRTVELFADAMNKAGNKCQLVGYEDQGHGFFNYGRGDGKYDATLAELDKFLVGLGYLKSE